MKQLGIVLALLIFACWFGQSGAQCMCNDTACVNQVVNENPNTQMCCEWVPQPSDTDPESLNDPRGTPLGFALLEYRGTDSNLPDLCVRVNFPSPLRNIQYVVAAVQSDSTICIQRRNPGPDDERTCGSGGVFYCESFTTGSSIELNFFCNDAGSCPVADSVFYLRPNVTTLDIDDEFFCDGINRTLPNSLLLSGIDNPTVEPNPMQPQNGGDGGASPGHFSESPPTSTSAGNTATSYTATSCTPPPLAIILLLSYIIIVSVMKI